MSKLNNEKSIIEKKLLLISWASHTFRNIITPLIKDLSNSYEIVITTVDYFIPESLINEFENMKHERIIKAYFIIPNNSKVKEQYLYLMQNTEILKSYEFDYWLTGSEMQINERYIKEYILPKHCKSIVLWLYITYLFNIPAFAKSLLIGEHEELKKVTGKKYNYLVPFEHYFFNRLKYKVKEKGGYRKVLLKSPLIVYRRVRGLYRRTIRPISIYYNRTVLPWLFLRRTFEYGPFDQLTQLGSGDADVVLFADPLEVKAHKRLYHKEEIYAVQHPNNGNCRCNSNIPKNNAVLSPLSGLVGVDKFKLYLRDFKVVIKEVGPNVSIYLRQHHRETVEWYYQLRDYLIDNGINTEVVGADKAISEVMCDYSGMAGFSSGALRDGRACCDYGFVVAFEAVSKSRYNEPKLVYGTGEGIGWVNEDGSYDPKIFQRNKFVPPKRKTVPEILNELSLKQDLTISQSSL